MPYTEAFIMETQRLASLVPFALPHDAVEDVEVAGYRCPKVICYFSIVNFLFHLHPWISKDVNVRFYKIRFIRVNLCFLKRREMNRLWSYSPSDRCSSRSSPINIRNPWNMTISSLPFALSSHMQLCNHHVPQVEGTGRLTYLSLSCDFSHSANEWTSTSELNAFTATHIIALKPNLLFNSRQFQSHLVEAFQATDMDRKWSVEWDWKCKYWFKKKKFTDISNSFFALFNF